MASGPGRAVRSGARVLQRLPLSSARVSGTIESLEEYVTDELGEPDRFTLVKEPDLFPGRPGHTLGREDALLAKTWSHDDWPGWRVTLPGGQVAGLDPLVLSGDGRAVAQSTFNASELEAHPLMHGRLPFARRVRGRLLLMIGPWWTGWYHWLLDLLPRAALLPLDEEPDAEVLVPAVLSPAQDESLTLVGVPPARRRPFSGGLVAADELVFPSLVAPTGNPPRWALGWLRERLAPPARRHDRRLYVSREDAAERRVANQGELDRLLEERGFETVLPGDLGAREQLGVFAEAEVVLGPHGAGLSNMCGATDATLVELHRDDMVRPCFFAQANAQGLEYWYMLCEPAGTADLRVDLGLLERTLDAAGIA
jgi:hypothetical protein